MENYSSFTSPVSCSDISVTPEGLILMAAFENGLRVFDFKGRELGGWRTVGNMEGDEVLTVDAYGKDAVVSLKNLNEVVRLQRGLRPIDRWYDLGLVATIESPIVRQSVCVDIDMIGIAIENPRPEIRLYRISRSEYVASLRLAHNVHNVVLTDELIVVAGSSVVHCETFFIEATSLNQMIPVWRHICNAFVFDMCFSWSKKCLYIAENGSICSIGLQKVGGVDKLLKVNLSQNAVNSLRKPLWIAADHWTDVPVIVVVGDDCRTIGVFQDDTTADETVKNEHVYVAAD